MMMSRDTCAPLSLEVPLSYITFEHKKFQKMVCLYVMDFNHGRGRYYYQTFSDPLFLLTPPPNRKPHSHHRNPFHVR